MDGLPRWPSLLTLRPVEGKMTGTMQWGTAGWASYAYYAWSRPTPSLGIG